MTWIKRLYDTYEHVYGREPEDGGARLLPICHTTQRAHIEIVLNAEGGFRRAAVVPRDDGVTLIPTTEASAGRSGTRPVAYPLCDKLQYVAGDFVAFGGVVTRGFAKDPGEPHRLFVKALEGWSASPHGHPKVAAILEYVRRGRLVRDIVEAPEDILRTDAGGRLLQKWEGERAELPALFSARTLAICRSRRWR